MMSPDKHQVQQQDRIQQLLERLGKAYLERHEYAEAYDKYSQLLEFTPEDKNYLLNTAIASIGMGRVSQDTLKLYEKAVENNRASDALKIGLATLFMQNNITTQFAVQVCEAAVNIAPPPAGSHKIRLFLKRFYEETGNTEKLSQIEHEVVFSTRNLETIQSYLEGLWWEGKFSEAETALKSAPNLNGVSQDLSAEFLLSHAYRHYFDQTPLADANILEQFHKTLEISDFSTSLSALRSFLLLRFVTTNNEQNESKVEKEVEEYEFILGDMSLDDLLGSFGVKKPEQKKNRIFGDFNFNQEILEVLESHGVNGTFESRFTYALRSVLFLQAHLQNNQAIPSKLNDLICMQLSKQQNVIVRQLGAGFFSLAKEPFEQIETLINLLRHLEEYNAAIPANERMSIDAAFSVIDKKQDELNDNAYLDELIKASHLLRYVEKNTNGNAGAGAKVIIRASDRDLKKLKSQGITFLNKGKIRLLPGFETDYAEIIWRNPLDLLEKGQSYKINRFELTKCLVKHNSYATYHAIDRQLDRPVIVKIMLPEDAVAILQNSAKRDELFEKLRSIGRINNPSIANLYDMGEHNNMIYFVREYIEGKPITEHEFTGEQRESEILSILQTLMRALSSAQRQGIAHLNLKAGNVWLSEAQQLKITDFQFSGFSEDFTKSKVLFSAQWRNIAPEILLGDFGDFRSDIYSLGILAYELITGQHPYQTTGSINSPNDIHKVKVLPLAKHKAPHHAAWDEFIMQAIHTDPNKRFQTLAEMELELRKIHMQLMQQALNATSA